MTSFNIVLIAIIVLGSSVLTIKYLNGDFESKVYFNYGSKVSLNKNITSKGNSMIQINGKTISVKGDAKNISVINGKIFINGQEVKDDNLANLPEIIINVEGNIEGNLETDYSNNISIKGNVNNVSNGSGNINIEQYASGDVKTGSGDIDIGGNVGAGVITGSGDVNINGNVSGSVKTGSGDIKYKK